MVEKAPYPLYTHSPHQKVGTLHVLIKHEGSWLQLEETLASVFSQKYRADRLLVNVLCQIETALPVTTKHPGVMVIEYTGRHGFITAMCTAITKSTADYYVLLDSGETFFPYAFNAVNSIFSTCANTHWLTGIQTIKSKEGFTMIYNTTASRRWSWHIFKQYFYARSGRFIPAASTFFTKALWSRAHAQLHFTSAAGFYNDLWWGFFKVQPLHTCDVYLSAADITPAQNSLLADKTDWAKPLRPGWGSRFTSFFYNNNIPYLRHYFKRTNHLLPIIRFDYITQTYFLSNY